MNPNAQESFKKILQSYDKSREMKRQGHFMMGYWADIDPTLTAETNWNNPDIRPNQFDQSFENWFNRIDTWGEVELFHYDEKGRKSRIDKAAFIGMISTAENFKSQGEFRVEIRHIYEVDFIRRFISMEGKQIEEVFKVLVLLKPALKKGLSLWTQLFN